MRVLDFINPDDTLTQAQRWSHYLVVIFCLITFYIGINLRDSVLNATSLYINTQAGIEANYPQNWLLDEGTDDYVFRVQDIAQSGFKTVIQVAVRPVSALTSERNLLDSLNLNRAPILTGYSVINVEPYTMPDETTATMMTYAYTEVDANPFLQSVPVSVEGIDILVIKRGQVIIITFLSDARTFDQNFLIFEQFLRDLEF